MAKDVFTGWLQTLDTERLERVHAEIVDQLDLIERELGRRESYLTPELVAAEFY
jgi:hypothetical protein